ncbi:MAG: uL15m family ribosomal protein [archaeon]
MTTNRRKKATRFRASRTHGVGMKKARGAGNRGGRGMAGTGKRADHKKPTIINKYGNTYFGKHKTKGEKVHYETMNIEVLDRKIDSLVKKGKAELKTNIYTINLAKIGIGKLLGTGNTNKKIKITVDMASKNAIEKVKKAGGEVITKAPKITKEPETEEA